MLRVVARRFLLPGLCCSLFGSAILAQQGRTSEPFPGLDAYVTRAMATWHVPGLALAIVRNDSVLYVKGYGVRSITSKEPVDSRTLFAIGSNTKSFTAAAIAMLVTDSAMRYDDPVTRYLPSFQLYDPWVTREATIRDLLTHRIGLGRQEAIWYGTHLSRDEVVRRTRFLKPSFSFRSRFGYSNLMYLVAGQAASAVSHKSWDELIHDRIFVPLSMTSSNTSVHALSGQADVATPHGIAHDTLFAIHYRDIDDVGPAGAINSNAIDMAQWLRFQLGDGVYNGKRLVGAAAFRENHDAQTILSTAEESDSAGRLSHLVTYGMGWAVTDYRRHDFWTHTGGIDGMLSNMALLPNEHFGLVILTNQNDGGILQPLQRWIFDRALAIRPVRDWSAELYRQSLAEQAQADSSERVAAQKRALNTTPSLPLAAYSGTYGDSVYGDIVVKLEGGALSLQRGELHGMLAHWHHDLFQVHWDDRQLGTDFVAFDIGPANTVESLTMDLLGDHMVLAHHPASPSASETH
jgi:CubicO group peptidase (beta-lactamase class C family)